VSKAKPSLLLPELWYHEMQAPWNMNMNCVTVPLFPHLMSQAFIVCPQMVFAISVSPTIDETKLLVVSATQREGCTYTVTTQAEQKIKEKWYTRLRNSSFTFVKQVHRETSAQKVDCKKTTCWSCSYHCHLLLQPQPPSRFGH